MNYSKVRFAALLAAFMFCAGLVFAQNSSPDSDRSSQTQNLTQSQIEESQFTFDGNLDAPEAPAAKPVSGFWVFVRMIIVLAIVIGVIYFIFRLMKKTIEPGADNDPFLRKVAGINLGPGKSVQVVTLIDRGFLLGVSDDSVNLLCEIEDKELINAMNVHADKTSNQFRAKNFAEVLEMFVPKKKVQDSDANETKNSGSVFDSSTQDLINSIKKKKIDNGESSENNGNGEE
ncbi:flagellar biosynthetic protein FliO [Treponema sp.]|uniref:flagellar biosynthetic protein FliO n=1 Tax=Treponema sp. TaxID=166 RepID=UPI00298E42E0|nr:flagellar biosynthetic protein FliO [Treponema sp.]MCQ2242008.1 flagellar biosynthetic protein FliO [Treponema sp.]